MRKLAAVALLVLAAPAPAGAKPAATRVARSDLGTASRGGVRDRVLTPESASAKRAARASQKGYGGVYRTSAGEPVHVFTSPRYAPDNSVNQSYADFLGGLVHRNELHSVVVYVAPYDEMQSICSAESDSCYSGEDNMLVVVGDTPPDGTSIADLLAHEYGHHVANHRHNDVGRALDYGPEYWSSYQHVCQGVGTDYFPGDQGAHYRRDPGEGWAETYRALNRSIEPWDVVSDVFYPTPRALTLARRDVRKPYDGGEYVVRKGRLRRHGSRWRKFKVPVENDGDVDLRLTGHGSLNGDLYVFGSRKSKKPLARAKRKGRREHLRGTYCGYRHLWIGVRRRSGAGSFRLKITLPFFTT